MSGFDRTLRTVKGEMEGILKKMGDVKVILDSDGEGTVEIPVGLYFQILGIVTWLGGQGEEVEEEDEDIPDDDDLPF